jgi:hypothetical protein
MHFPSTSNVIAWTRLLDLSRCHRHDIGYAFYDRGVWDERRNCLGQSTVGSFPAMLMQHFVVQQLTIFGLQSILVFLILALQFAARYILQHPAQDGAKDLLC